jgi:phytol kinase
MKCHYTAAETMKRSNLMISHFIGIFLLKAGLFWAIMYGAGSLVHYGNIKVNYTRKIVHFACFFIPPLIGLLLPGESTLLEDIGDFLTFVVYLISYGLFASSVRERVPLIQRMFLALDRPEDRPHTVKWLVSQLVLAAMVMTMANALLRYYGHPEVLILISPLAMIGDGLAEPVGVRFGKHRYSTYAIFSRKKYHRTLEGSATIVVASFFIIFLSRALFTPDQFFLALLAIPPVLSLAEAFSPHTWDTPFLFASSGVMLFGVKHFF